MDFKNFKPKSFWERPEGVTGLIFLSAILIGGGYLFAKYLPIILHLAENTLYLAGMLGALAAIVYMILDPKMRNLVFYMYKSVMRWITGLFVQIDPVGILKSYTEHLEASIVKMSKQVGQLRGQMHKLKEIIVNNQKEVQSNINLASKAKEGGNNAQMILQTRKAGRLQDSNVRLEDLYKKMEVLYRVLTKMQDNSTILVEDIKDQVRVKEVEQKAIQASHSAMQAAMNILNGDPDKKMMFDMAMEAVANDVSTKMGEMERFMEVSNKFMQSIDLQNGVFEEEGMAMLEKWEKEGTSLLLGNEKNVLINKQDTLDLTPPTQKEKPMVRDDTHRNQYDDFFN
jgi:hypothetical protein